MKESLHIKVDFYFRCLLPLEEGGGLMAALFSFKQRTFLQHKRENPAWINGRFNEHISQQDAMVGFGHTMISAIKIHSGLKLQKSTEMMMMWMQQVQSTESIKKSPGDKGSPETEENATGYDGRHSYPSRSFHAVTGYISIHFIASRFPSLFSFRAPHLTWREVRGKDVRRKCVFREIPLKRHVKTVFWWCNGGTAGSPVSRLQQLWSPLWCLAVCICTYMCCITKTVIRVHSWHFQHC